MSKDWAPEETSILLDYYDYGPQRVQSELLRLGYKRSRASIIRKAGHIKSNDIIDFSLAAKPSVVVYIHKDDTAPFVDGCHEVRAYTLPGLYGRDPSDYFQAVVATDELEPGPEPGVFEIPASRPDILSQSPFRPTAYAATINETSYRLEWMPTYKSWILSWGDTTASIRGDDIVGPSWQDVTKILFT